MNRALPNSNALSNALLPSIALLSAIALSLPSNAEAQCPDGASFCAEIEVEGSVSIGGRRQPPPPPPPAAEVQVEVQQVDPNVEAEVYVQPAPRRRGRVVVVRPAPPPPPPQPVVVQPAQRQTTVTVHTERRVQVRREQRWNRKVGLSLRAGAMMTDRIQMGGMQLGARFRPSRVFGVELGLGTYVGQDYNGFDRREHPLTFDFMFFLPKASRFQAYALFGGGFSFANVDTDPDFIDDWDSDTRYAYIGGQVGLGVEWRINPVVAIGADVRGFLRTRIDDDLEDPEFVDASSGRTTNSSAGALGTIGLHLYF